MNDMRNAWLEVGSDLEALALKLRLHLEQVEPQHAEHDGVRQAVCRLANEVEAALAAVGNAVVDDAVREDARTTAHAFKQAVTTTFAELGQGTTDAVREHVGR